MYKKAGKVCINFESRDTVAREIVACNSALTVVVLQVLSRAFRNRFVELHFDELPSKELEKILQERGRIPMSYAKKMVAVLLDLQVSVFDVNTVHMYIETFGCVLDDYVIMFLLF